MNCGGLPLRLAPRRRAAGWVELGAGCQLSCGPGEALCPDEGRWALELFCRTWVQPLLQPDGCDDPVGLLVQVGCCVTFMRGDLFTVCDELLFPWEGTGILSGKWGFCLLSHMVSPK